MANLYYTVFDGAGNVANGDPRDEGRVVFTTTSVQSAPLPTAGQGHDNRRWVVRVFSDADAFVTWGESPEAKTDGTDGRPVSAGVAEYFNIQSGHRIAAIQRA